MNQSDVLSAMSVEMCLTLAKTLGMQSKSDMADWNCIDEGDLDAAIFTAMADSLLKILVVLEPLSLSSGGKSEQSPILTSTLKSIQDFANSAPGDGATFGM